MSTWRKIWHSFGYARDGLTHALLTQRNMRIHFLAAFCVIFLCVVIQVQNFEIIAALFSIALVIALELVNTAIENVVDLMVEVYHTSAKVAKDVAAAAVLVAAANALIVAYLIFYNKLHPIVWRSFSSLMSPPYIGVLLMALLFLILAIVAYAVNFHRRQRHGVERNKYTG